MADVKDGSVAWSIESIYNAGQLNGLTAEQIKNSAISGSGKVNAVVIAFGSLTFSMKGGLHGSYDNVKTIPLPNGYDRSQCRYFIDANFVSANSGENVASIKVDTGCINQSTGVVTAICTDKYTMSISSYYICIAVK